MTLRNMLRKIKACHPDRVIGFELGQMVEFFDDDAVYVGRVLSTETRKVIDSDGGFVCRVAALRQEVEEKIDNLLILSE